MRDKILGIRINEVEARQLQEYAAAVDRPMSRVVRQALRALYTAEPPPQRAEPRDPAP